MLHIPDELWTFGIPRPPAEALGKAVRVVITEEVDADSPTARACLEMTVRTEDFEPALDVTLRFTGIIDLHIAFQRPPFDLCGIEIVNIERDQWERVRWAVRSYEGDDFRFYSRTAEVVRIVPVTP